MIGDGILLDGKTLYVVQNQNNRIAVVKPRREPRQRNRHPHDHQRLFKMPTTIASHGSGSTP